MIDQPYVDIVCTGEGELALLELVNRMAARQSFTDVPTMWVKHDGVVHRNEIGMLENDLDRFPFPEKQLWRDYGCFRDNLEVFTAGAAPSSARSATSTTAGDLRREGRLPPQADGCQRDRGAEAPPQPLRREVRVAARRQLHDQRPLGRGVLRGLGREIGLPWYCFGYPTTIKPRLLKAMKASNCAMIFMGVDSGDPDVRKELMERPMSDELIYEKARLIHEHASTRSCPPCTACG